MIVILYAFFLILNLYSYANENQNLELFSYVLAILSYSLIIYNSAKKGELDKKVEYSNNDLLSPLRDGHTHMCNTFFSSGNAIVYPFGIIFQREVKGNAATSFHLFMVERFKSWRYHVLTIFSIFGLPFFQDKLASQMASLGERGDILAHLLIVNLVGYGIFDYVVVIFCSMFYKNRKA